MQPLLGQHTGQRHTGKTSCLHSIRKGNKGKQWKVRNSKLGPGLSIPASMKGLSTSSSPSSASGLRNGQSCYDFLCRPAPPPATQCLSQASKDRAIASATSFMTVFLDAKSFWCAEDWRYWNSLILSFSTSFQTKIRAEAGQYKKYQKVSQHHASRPQDLSLVRQFEVQYIIDWESHVPNCKSPILQKQRKSSNHHFFTYIISYS